MLSFIYTGVHCPPLYVLPLERLCSMILSVFVVFNESIKINNLSNKIKNYTNSLSENIVGSNSVFV